MNKLNNIVREEGATHVFPAESCLTTFAVDIGHSMESSEEYTLFGLPASDIDTVHTRIRTMNNLPTYFAHFSKHHTIYCFPIIANDRSVLTSL